MLCRGLLRGFRDLRARFCVARFYGVGRARGALLGDIAASCASFDGDLSTEVVCKENL